MLRPSLKERKQYLAEIATSVFAKQGYRAASLQNVADVAGISKAGIYHYFKTKEDILYYLIKTKHDKFLHVLKDCILESEKKKLDPEDTLRKLIYAYANFINNEKELRLIVLQDRHQLTGENKRNLRRIEREILQTLRDQIKKLPGVKKKYNPNVISFLIISMSHWMGSWLKENGNLDQEEAIKQSTDIILYGAIQKKNEP